MNKIIIDNNIISSVNNNIIIKNNNVNFIKSGNYTIEVSNTNKIDITINLKPSINIQLFIYSTNNNINTNIKYILEENSNLSVHKFYHNTKNNINEKIFLNGNHSNIDYRLSSISERNEEYRLKIYHNNLNVKSNISNRCIGLDNSRISFVIDSILEKGNTGCFMNQDTKIICLGDVDARIEPNMLIDEDDVEAKHGSVIGKFNNDNLFYLMTRGISEEEAMKLMIKGFILSNLKLSKTDEKKIIDIIKKKLK